MGQKYQHWQAETQQLPTDYSQLVSIVKENRKFQSVDQLVYGDFGLDAAHDAIAAAIRAGKRIALYADYDVDGTMSCVSWIWFFKAIGFTNFAHYIPDRFKEGYGVNLQAVQTLVEQHGAQVIITMDTGITANEEAAWCKQRGIDFICTDHHKIQPDKMPDSIILNPKTHPDPMYQELCGAGITFVLLRKLGGQFVPPASVWTDILALVGMATICDVVPLNGVNHKLAQAGVSALLASKRPILRGLLKAAAVDAKMDERDVGFRLGPRINAVGRLDHADKVIAAFVNESPETLIQYMGQCNEKRKLVQEGIVTGARESVQWYAEDPILFLGGDWHQGVVGIAASKIAEEAWKPTWLFQRTATMCKGSARSIPGFDVTDAMTSAKHLFLRFGGHRAAGGFSFHPENEDAIRQALNAFALKIRAEQPAMWESRRSFDCFIPRDLARVELMDHLESMRPFGHCFEEPTFAIEAPIERVQFYRDKKTDLPKHTAVHIGDGLKVMFFNEVHSVLKEGAVARFLVTASRNEWQGVESLSLFGSDFEITTDR